MKLDNKEKIALINAVDHITSDQCLISNFEKICFLNSYIKLYKYDYLYFKRAQLYKMAGEFHLAIKDLAEAITLNPSNKEAQDDYESSSTIYRAAKNKDTIEQIPGPRHEQEVAEFKLMREKKERVVKRGRPKKSKPKL
jgi:tetratricopeptide (TPR) repeat protein